METQQLQEQVAALNQKVDILLEYVQQQKLRADRLDDLVSDLSIIGKDMYDSSVEMLDTHAVEINPEEVKLLFLKLLRNIRTFNSLMDTLESGMDFLKDAGPIVNEVIIDFTKKLHELEKKGYFEFLSESMHVLDNLVSHYSKEDIRKLSDNIVVIMDTIRNVTQPEMLNSINNAVKVFSNLNNQEIREYSLWGLMREMRKPEMKRALGLMVTMMKNLAVPTEQKSLPVKN
jgi:uncharacterized protein YjgD (DUF1641 family)